MSNYKLRFWGKETERTVSGVATSPESQYASKAKKRHERSMNTIDESGILRMNETSAIFLSSALKY